MSNSLAIASVTATLYRVLSKLNLALPGDPDPDSVLTAVGVTTKPLDKARDVKDDTNQINIFLYHTMPNAALRNMTLPDGEPGVPALALNLYYLITAYGAGSDDLLAHRVLGRAMAILHDLGEMTPADIKAALPGNDLYRQVERVRINPHAFSSEELSKLWTAFQTNYRVSAAYEVSVVLIDPVRPAITPLPVRQRGPLETYFPPPPNPNPNQKTTDSGVLVHPDLTPLGPTLTALILPNRQPAVRIGFPAGPPGEVITVLGAHLGGTTVVGHFQHATQAVNLDLPATTIAPNQVTFSLPSDAAAQVNWAAGVYSLWLEIDARPSNSLSFALAPLIAPTVSGRDVNNDVVVTVVVHPVVTTEQQVRMLFDDQELRPRPFPPPRTGTLQFDVVKPSIGPPPHSVRLRVEGVDSLLFQDYTAEVPAYDPAQQVTVT